MKLTRTTQDGRGLTIRKAYQIHDEVDEGILLWKKDAEIYETLGGEGAETIVWTLGGKLEGMYGVYHWEGGPLELITKSLRKARRIAARLSAERGEEYQEGGR